MPKHVKARAAQDEQEERQVRKLAKSHHAPADGKFHAQMVLLSWAGKTPNEIAAELGCHPQTVRIHLKRFTLEGVTGLGMRPGSGRKPRLTERERSRILALVKQAPPGHLETQADGTRVARDEEGSAQWTLGALAQAAKAAGIKAQTQPRTTVVCHYTQPPKGSTTICTDELGPVVPRTFPPAPGWSANGHRIKALMDDSRGPEKTWVYGALRVRDGKELTRCAASRNSKGYIALLADIEADNPTGDLHIITDTLSSHNRLETRTWLDGHPRIQHVFIPDFRVLAQPARGLVAPFPSRCAGWPERGPPR
jgi:transposase